MLVPGRNRMFLKIAVVMVMVMVVVGWSWGRSWGRLAFTHVKLVCNLARPQFRLWKSTGRCMGARKLK